MLIPSCGARGGVGLPDSLSRGGGLGVLAGRQATNTPTISRPPPLPPVPGPCPLEVTIVDSRKTCRERLTSGK